MYTRIYFLVLSLFWIPFFAEGQDIMAVHIEGQVKICHKSEQEKAAKNLFFGPLSADQKIILGSNARVKLIRSTGEQCELSNSGTYIVSKLKFSKPDNSGFVSKMGEFIMSFLEASHSSESKESYTNSVLAISRGDQTAPVLEFPFEGNMPLNADMIEFRWVHACDTCTYLVQWYDRETKLPIQVVETKSKSYMYRTPGSLFLPNKSYYWTVKVAGLDAEYPVRGFKTIDLKDFHQRTQELEAAVDKEWPGLQPLPRIAYMVSSLKDAGELNFAIFYAREQFMLSSDSQLKEQMMAYYFSLLEEQLQAKQP